MRRSWPSSWPWSGKCGVSGRTATARIISTGFPNMRRWFARLRYLRPGAGEVLRRHRRRTRAAICSSASWPFRITSSAATTCLRHSPPGLLTKPGRWPSSWWIAALDGARRALLEALVAEHLKQHGGDLEASLAAVSSLGSVRGDLERIDDADLQASLGATASRCSDGDGATATYTPASRRAGARSVSSASTARAASAAFTSPATRSSAAMWPSRRSGPTRPPSPIITAASFWRRRSMVDSNIPESCRSTVSAVMMMAGRSTRCDSSKATASRRPSGRTTRSLPARPDRRRVPQAAGAVHRRLRSDRVRAQQGGLHRNLKPHNVMLGRFGETLLIDWGLAKATGRREPVGLDAIREATLVPPSGSGHAPTLGVLGSPPYMSPEQAAGEVESLGPATDVYGLGAILFELLPANHPCKERQRMRFFAVFARVQSGRHGRSTRRSRGH